MRSRRQNPPLAARFTIIDSAQGPVGKSFDLTPDGKLTTSVTATITHGQARRVEVPDLAAFLQIRAKLKPNEALIYGIADAPKANIAPQNSNEVQARTAIPRDARHFRYPDGPGVLMFDHDPQKGSPNRFSHHELDAIFAAALPGWSATPRRWLPSSSAFIGRKSTRQTLIGPGGWRCYALIDRAEAIPRVTQYLYQELWRRNHGYIEITNSGKMLDRTLIDTSVATPYGLDFAAPPTLGPDLERLDWQAEYEDA